MTRITQQTLESYLWGAAVLLRGTVDAGDYKQFIFPLLFFKRLCDVFDEETVTALRESGGDQDFALFPENHRFQIPADAHWREIRKGSRDVGRGLQQAMRAIETANPDKLFGIFGDAQWTNKDRLSDAMLRDLIEHFSTLELTVANLPEDELGQGYEYLIKKFADDSGHTAAEFYTNRTVVHLMTEMLDVQSGESVYDPTCGTGGMLLSCVTHLRRAGKEWRNVKLYGQERNLMTSSIARMNCFLHGIEDFRIERGDTLAEPKLVEGDHLQRFDVVLANPPYSIKQWNREAFAADPWGRNVFGVPPQGRADYAFQQHILQSLKLKTGRCAVLWPHGVLFRDDEAAIRRKLIEADLVECVVGLGTNLFYNSAMESCIVICRTQKPKDRRGKILLIDAKREVTRERAQSFLTDGHIARITLAYMQFKSEPGFSCTASLEDIRQSDYNLNIALYISEAPRSISQKSDTLASVNTAFRKLLGSSNQLHSTMAALLRSEVMPEIASESAMISLPEWVDRAKWRKVRLGEVVRQVRDKVDSASSAGISHYLPGGGISASSFKINGWKTVDDGVMGPAFHMRFMPGHVLYKSRVPHGVAVADRNAICANTTYVLESNCELLDQRLLPYLLVTNKFRQFEKDNNRGSTNLFLNYSDIARFEFDLPPLDQQRRLAEILWALDKVNSNTEFSLKHVASTIQAHAVSLLDREAFGKWPVSRISECVKIGSGQIDPKQEPYASMILVAPDYIEQASGRLIGKDTAAQQNAVSGKFIFNSGDVIFSKIRPNLRKCILANFDGICSSDMFVLTPIVQKVRAQFLLAILLSDAFTKYAVLNSKGTAFPRINRTAFEDFSIPLPPISFQDEICKKLNQLNDISSELLINKENVHRLLSALLDVITEDAP